MNEIEAKQVLVESLNAFPGVAAWIKANSPDPSATIRTWAKAIESLERHEVESVIDRWSTGKLKAPEGYEKECFHLHIRQVVMGDRAKRMREQVREKVINEHTRYAKQFYEKILGPFMAQVLGIRNQYDQGLITIEERDDRIGELRDKAITMVDRQGGKAA